VGVAQGVEKRSKGRFPPISKKIGGGWVLKTGSSTCRGIKADCLWELAVRGPRGGKKKKNLKKAHGKNDAKGFPEKIRVGATGKRKNSGQGDGWPAVGKGRRQGGQREIIALRPRREYLAQGKGT